MLTEELATPVNTEHSQSTQNQNSLFTKRNIFSKITYSLLTDKDIIAAAHCIARNFIDEPIVKHMNITKEEFFPFAKAFCEKAAKDQLSYIAKDEFENIVGCLIGEDLTITAALPKLTPKFDPILALLEKLPTEAFERKNIVPRESDMCHGALFAVDRHLRGTPLACELLSMHLELAAAKGFKYYYGSAAPASYKMIKNKLSCEELNTIKYKDFVYMGSKPFEGLEGEVNAIFIFPKYANALIINPNKITSKI